MPTTSTLTRVKLYRGTEFTLTTTEDQFVDCLIAADKILFVEQVGGKVLFDVVSIRFAGEDFRHYALGTVDDFSEGGTPPSVLTEKADAGKAAPAKAAADLKTPPK